MLIASPILAPLTTVGALATAALTGIYVLLTYRILQRQTNAAEANAYGQLRSAWNELDNLMMDHSELLDRLAGEPLEGPVLPDGRLNPDRRIYLAFRFFGTVEFMVLLRDEYKLARAGYIESLDVTMAALMSVPDIQKAWELLKEGYPLPVREYVESFGRQPW